MSLFAPPTSPSTAEARHSFLDSDLDFALTAQFVVAWAGESGDEERRLGWWRSDMVHEFGGEDLFRRLLPHSWAWAVFQAAREAARRVDEDRRRQDHDPDRLVSLFSLGFEVDERLDERLQDLKRIYPTPADALPGLARISEAWSREAFFDWVDGHGSSDFTASPAGRRLKGSAPAGLDLQIRRLVAALAPPADSYPCPHFRKST